MTASALTYIIGQALKSIFLSKWGDGVLTRGLKCINFAVSWSNAARIAADSLLPMENMENRKKKNRAGIGKQITATVSVALVLLILGIVGSLAIATRSITDNIKENLGFTLIIDESATEPQIDQLKQRFTSAPYVASYSYMSADDILQQEETVVGFDIDEVIGVNPYQPEFNVKVKSQFANADSLKAITGELAALPQVDHPVVHTEMVNDINSNIRAVSMVLVAIAAALLIISFVLINNTVRLTIYSHRFILYTMQLVGATAAFIRRPIIWRNIVCGIIAALLAIAMLVGIRFLIDSDPQTKGEIGTALPWGDLAIIFAGMVALGVIICGLASYLATNKYLRQDYDDLF